MANHAAGKGKRRPPRAEVAAWHGTSSEEEARALYQERLGLFARIMLYVFVGFASFTLALYQLFPGTKPARGDIQNIIAIVGLGVMVTIWFVWLRGKRTSTLQSLLTLDLVFVTLIGAIFGVSAYLSIDKPINMISCLLWNGYMVFGRVLYVPSDAKRTFWLSSIAMAPLVTAAVAASVNYQDYELAVPGTALAVGTTVFAGTAVFIATVGSRVIYGLRKQVREAMQLGQYTLGEKIGEGGMGEVYKATHAMLRRPTAVKLLLPGRTSEEHLERFEREVQMTAQLTHPNTVAIFDYGRSPEGVFYYAMEFLEGVDLERLVRTYGALPAPRVVHILVQMCGALEEAHGRGLVHRDIKPANAILCKRGQVPDWIKVVDFGLVKDFEKDTESTGSVLAGTPAYLAPEAVSAPTTVGPPGDLYAVGAVGYFLLTGSVVFEAENVVEMCVHHVRTPPTPPSERTDNEISPALEAIVLRCLAKNPKQRPDSARTLRNLLRELPEAELWNEELAAAWWETYEQRPSAKHVLPAGATTLLSPLTMTVDIVTRAQQK